MPKEKLEDSYDTVQTPPKRAPSAPDNKEPSSSPKETIVKADPPLPPRARSKGTLYPNLRNRSSTESLPNPYNL